MDSQGRMAGFGRVQSQPAAANQSQYLTNQLSRSIQENNRIFCMRCNKPLQYVQGSNIQTTEMSMSHQCQSCNSANFFNKCPSCTQIVQNSISFSVQEINNLCVSSSCPVGRNNQSQRNNSNLMLKKNSSSMSQQIPQKEDIIIYRHDAAAHTNQPKCLHCNIFSINLENVGATLFEGKSQEQYQCPQCLYLNFIGKCSQCFTFFLCKKPLDQQSQLDNLCQSFSCQIGERNLQEERLQIETLDVIVRDYNDGPIKQCSTEMELEEQKSNNERFPMPEIQKNFVQAEQDALFIDIDCLKCKTSKIRLAKNLQNIVYKNFKREQCNNCMVFVYYTFCECGELIYSDQEFTESIIECSTECDKVSVRPCTANRIMSNPGNQQQMHEGCEGKIKYSRKSENEPYEFFRKTDCEKCATPVYYFYCQCQELLTRNSKPFLYGEFIDCTNPECHLKRFQLVRCPLDHCQQINIFRGKYQMGEVIQCLKCFNDFQQITCPICYDSLYFNGEYTTGGFIKCPCNGVFQQVTCPHCCKAQFRIKDKDHQILSGMPIVCDNEQCGQEFYNAICPNCHMNIKKDRLEKEFKQGNYYKCEDCQLHIEWFSCKENHVNMHKVEDENLRRQQRNTFSYGKRNCTMENCQSKLTLSYCPFCQKINKQEDHVNEGPTKCPIESCNKDYTTVLCEKCKSLNSVKGIENTYKCFQCDVNIDLTSMEDPNSGKCKVCYEDRAIYVMNNCMHVVCCDDCKDNLGEHGRCPICRQPGQPKKLFF